MLENCSELSDIELTAVAIVYLLIMYIYMTQNLAIIYDLRGMQTQ